MKKKNFFGLFSDDETADTEMARDENLLLREEELDVAKDRIRTGEVTLHKDIIEEHTSVDVPVTHEEVVIERRALDHQQSNSPIGEEETIHIPVSEERVEIGKHTEIIGEISAHKREVEETKHFDELVKREEARIDVDGDRKRIIAKERDKK
ncbi:MAG: YsnF/AvaK domain-containing protein [Firmicutes bacterium]|nr:YsnF/AvaK domain-containing protein [Bacillota bacterium]